LLRVILIYSIKERMTLIIHILLKYTIPFSNSYYAYDPTHEHNTHRDNHINTHLQMMLEVVI